MILGVTFASSALFESMSGCIHAIINCDSVAYSPETLPWDEVLRCFIEGEKLASIGGDELEPVNMKWKLGEGLVLTRHRSTRRMRQKNESHHHDCAAGVNLEGRLHVYLSTS